MTVQGRIVAVTGAASGIGAALAELAAARGAAGVAVIDVDASGARAVADRIAEGGVKSAAFVCDLADVDAVEGLADEVVHTLGVPGLVCANAGVTTEPAALLESDVGDLRWALSVNVVGTWATLRAFSRAMTTSSESGWFMVTASEHAIGIPFAGNGAYTVSKHALLGLADVVRRELPPHLGISVLIPGLVATGLWRSGSLRSADYGGPRVESEQARALLAHGMDPDIVAARALDGVEAKRFMVATHQHAKRYFQDRAADVDEAFDALERAVGSEESLDVMDLAARLGSATSD